MKLKVKQPSLFNHLAHCAITPFLDRMGDAEYFAIPSKTNSFGVVLYFISNRLTGQRRKQLRVNQQAHDAELANY